jgi:large subunit ribosomal protein L19
MNIIAKFEQQQIAKLADNKKIPYFKAGDTVKVHQVIQEKGKIRLQVFEGLVLARKHGKEAGATFTVRKVTEGVGVERIFPLYSPLIDKIEVIRRAKVRRAKLFYIREKAAKEISRQMRNAKNIKSSEAKAEKEEVAEEVK